MYFYFNTTHVSTEIHLQCHCSTERTEMEENKVLISLDIYDELASMGERIGVVRSLYYGDPSLDKDTILRILGIRIREKEDA